MYCVYTNMRKVVALLSLALAAAIAHPAAIPIPFFPTPVFAQENFDAIPAGPYFAAPAFSAPVVGAVFMAPGGAGPLDISPPPGFLPPLSPPHTCYGQSSGIGVRVFPDMRRFGAYFRNRPNIGVVPATFVKIEFYNNNTLVGSNFFPLNSTWTWHGYMLVPTKYNRVLIFGNTPNGAGVDMDDMRVRPF
jgi:hypothetical protein